MATSRPNDEAASAKITKLIWSLRIGEERTSLVSAG